MGEADALARLLEQVLRRPEHQLRWRPHAQARRGAVNQRAVARVLAVATVGEDDEARLDAAQRTWVHRLSRALRGDGASDWTIGVLADVFDLAPADRMALHAAAAGAWATAEPAELATTPATAGPVRTVHLSERHVLGDDGLPDRHETVQVVEALEGGVDRHRYVFTYPHVQVEVVRGGRSCPVLPDGDGRWCCEIHFDRPLTVGEQHRLVYRSVFLPNPARAELPPEFLRVATRPVGGASISVAFSPRCRPRDAWWVELDGIDATAAEVHRERVALRDGEATRIVPSIDRATVGFRWAFA